MVFVYVFAQDGLFLITNEPEIICGYQRAVLTPNAIEFSRLYEKVVSTHSVKLAVTIIVYSSC